MAALTGNYTLTYSESAQGFPSFYSYYPDMMIGMNNYLYSFKGGNIYRHNTNDLRNNYYGVQYNSQITSIFNEQPLENKLFKTINLESDSAWGGTYTSDQQTTGSIDASYFVKKEGAWYAFMRNTGATPADAGEYPLRSLNGIGASSNTNVAAPAAAEIIFAIGTDIGSIVSIGDTLYFIAAPVGTNSTSGTTLTDATKNFTTLGIQPGDTVINTTVVPNTSTTVSVVGTTTLTLNTNIFPVIGQNYSIPVGPNSTPVLCGTITNIQVDLPAGINKIIVDTTAGSLPAGTTDYFMFAKNQVAESHGILGHYCKFVLTNTDTTATELFAVESEVMKSFP